MTKRIRRTPKLANNRYFHCINGHFQWRMSENTHSANRLSPFFIRILESSIYMEFGLYKVRVLCGSVTHNYILSKDFSFSNKLN